MESDVVKLYSDLQEDYDELKQTYTACEKEYKRIADVNKTLKTTLEAVHKGLTILRTKTDYHSEDEVNRDIDILIKMTVEGMK